ncbi:MAG: metallophosphoesterase [Proteobacteria bacterium]|nr:metallophosphoesterase [Pseudomonadota bacterium]
MRVVHFSYLMLFFSFSSLAHTFQHNGMVMDVLWGDIRKGSDIGLYPPHGGNNQNFIFENGSIKLASDRNYCVDIYNDRDSRYRSVVLWTCHGGNNQKFTIVNGFIHPVDKPDECITVKSGNDLKSEKCTFSAQQKFYIPKVCTYKHTNYRSMTECTSGNVSFVKDNDTMSSVSVVNAVVELYEHANYGGEKIVTNRNIPSILDVSSRLNDKISSLRTSSVKTFLITSDPQLTCTQNCEGISGEQSKSNIYAQYKLFNDYFSGADAVFINGDLTEFGHKNEWKEFKKLAGSLKIPYYYGLGNHDMYNNLGDCYENNCAIRSVTNLYHHVNGKYNIASFDAHRAHGYIFPSIRETITGSLSYSMDFGSVLVIQLNDYKSEHNPLKIDQYSSGAWGNGAMHYVIDRFQDADYTWLERQLYSAYLKRQTVIVNQHNYRANAGKLFELLDRYNVQLRFAGHYHDFTGGGREDLNGFYMSGSSALKTYLKTEVDADNNEARIYLGENNTSTPKLIKKITLEQPDGIPTPPLSPPVYLRVKNNGGYEAFATIVYRNKDGKRIEKYSGKLLLGNYWGVSVPAGSTVEYFEAKNNTGLVWEPQRRIFKYSNLKSDTCIEVKGTTLNAWTRPESCR